MHGCIFEGVDNLFVSSISEVHTMKVLLKRFWTLMTPRKLQCHSVNPFIASKVCQLVICAVSVVVRLIFAFFFLLVKIGLSMIRE